MRNKIAFFAGCCFLLTVLASQARATTIACYDWDCNEITHFCTFDATCSSWTGNLFGTSWDFGDGGSTFVGGLTTSHTYSTPYPTVQLTVVPLSTSSASISCGIVVWNNIGPAVPTHGRCH